MALAILAFKGFTTITNAGDEVAEPKKNVGRAIIISLVICLVVYLAVSRMLAMLTEMKLIPRGHFGMPGNTQKHTLVYTVVIAAVLAAVFDLSRIASLGAIFYLIMVIVIHWGVLRHLYQDLGANRVVLGAAIVLDVVALGAFLIVKGSSDPLIVVVSLYRSPSPLRSSVSTCADFGPQASKNETASHVLSRSLCSANISRPYSCAGLRM